MQTEILRIQDPGIKINTKKFAAKQCEFVCLLIFPKAEGKKTRNLLLPPIFGYHKKSKSFLNYLLLAILLTVQAEHKTLGQPETFSTDLILFPF